MGNHFPREGISVDRAYKSLTYEVLALVRRDAPADQASLPASRSTLRWSPAVGWSK